MKATSKIIFGVSRNKSPSKATAFKAIVTPKGLNVRTWAGAENAPCSFSPLSQGEFVNVCDVILSQTNVEWYYISYKGKYGFINASYVEKIPDKAVRFLDLLSGYHDYIKAHYKLFEYHYVSAVNNNGFEYVKKLVSAGKMVGITCLVPIGWALKEIGLKRKDGKSWVSGVSGSFKTYFTGDFTTTFTRITTGDAIGKTVVQAVDKGLLKAGDIIAFKGVTHTFVYTGKGYIMYDGGSANGNYSKGIMPDYSKHYTTRKISEILRWRE